MNSRSDKHVVSAEASALSVRLGKRINALRTQQNLNLHEISKKAGLDWGHLQGIEAGTRNPSIAVLDRLARALGVDLSTLFDLRSEATERRRRAELTRRLREMIDTKLSTEELAGLTSLLERLR